MHLTLRIAVHGRLGRQRTEQVRVPAHVVDVSVSGVAAVVDGDLDIVDEPPDAQLLVEVGSLGATAALRRVVARPDGSLLGLELVTADDGLLELLHQLVGLTRPPGQERTWERARSWR